MREIEIRGRSEGSNPGPVLYRGKAETRKAFLEELVAQGKSLAGADLRKADLSFAELEGADFTGAMLDGSCFRGAHLKDATFRGASAIATRFDGADVQRGRFEAADLSRAEFGGSLLTWSNFRGARLDDADFTRAAASSVVFTRASASGAKFRNATMRNADFGSARLVRADFRGTDLTSSLPIDTEHLPDRTRLAVVVGCLYDQETKIDGSLPKMRYDQMANSLARALMWGTSTFALMGLMSHVPEVTDWNSLQSAVGSGFGIVAIATAVSFLKEGVVGWVQDKTKEFLQSAQLKVRAAAEELARRGANWKTLGVAVAKERDIAPLRRALAATVGPAKAEGTFSLLRAFRSDVGVVIVCDRRHLAMALGAIAANHGRGYPVERDLTLLRCPPPEDGSPVCLRFLRDGRLTAIWHRERDRMQAVVYGVDGAPEESSRNDLHHLPEGARSADEVIAGFEGSLLREHGMSGFEYPHGTHYTHSGVDGTLIVHRISDRRLDNPLGPAIVMADGRERYFRNGRELGGGLPAPRPRKRSKRLNEHKTLEQESSDLLASARPG